MPQQTEMIHNNATNTVNSLNQPTLSNHAFSYAAFAFCCAECSHSHAHDSKQALKLYLLSSIQVAAQLRFFQYTHVILSTYSICTTMLQQLLTIYNNLEYCTKHIHVHCSTVHTVACMPYYVCIVVAFKTSQVATFLYTTVYMLQIANTVLLTCLHITKCVNIRQYIR
jgi:hypothetical protein